jgi:dihydroorotase
MPVEDNTVTVYGRIARHEGRPFWGRITIDRDTGLITHIRKRKGLRADHMYGPNSLIFAGFGDVHIHAREDETGAQCYKEEYETAADAALNGGVVHVSAMPNTPNPVTSKKRFAWHRQRIKKRNHPVSILNYVGIDTTTRPIGKPGEHMYKLYFGKSVGTLTVMYASDLDSTLSGYQGHWISFHVEYEPIVLASVMGKTHSDRRPASCVNEGLRLLLPLIEKYGIHAKLCHWPVDEGTFALIQEYRARGCHIELEVSPLHLYFNKEDAERDPSLWLAIQMNPAVQTAPNQRKLIQGLKSGFIDFLATDHAPHTEDEKHLAFAKFKAEYPGKNNVEIAALVKAANPELFRTTCCENNTSGAPWLDTYALVCTWLMREHGFTPMDIARIAAYNPGKFVNRFLAQQFPGRNFGKGFGRVEKGFMGSLTVLNTARSTTVNRAYLRTKVGWSPFVGTKLPGAVDDVFIAGKLQRV